MWSPVVAVLRCPLCSAPLTEAGVDRLEDGWVETGVLTCASCKAWYPVVRGVPVLLPYATQVHHQFAREHAGRLECCAPGYLPPTGAVPPGEQLVMGSFSKEWLEYDFDGVIWEMDYGDHEQRFLAEMADYAPRKDGSCWFLEIGCGLGITTTMAQRNFGGQAIGVDLSLAAWRAAAANRENRSVHFVQASVFALPFEVHAFDAIYTRGVLHHTYSTRDAFRKLAPLCRPGGTFYVWVYGPKSINDNAFRRVVYGSEVLLRFVLNRCPAWLSSALLAPLALGYLAFNRLRHWRNPRIQPYNYTRALHAARDRYTPEFAHRHPAGEVCGWFRDDGFTDVQVVGWQRMPSADRDDYRRNTGVRGRRAARLESVDPSLAARASARRSTSGQTQ